MTVTEFNRAGLDKLDKQQLETLNNWLSRYIRSLCAEKPATPPGAATEPAMTPPAGGEKAAQGPTTAAGPTQGQEKTTAPSPSSAEVAAFGAPEKPKQQEPDRIESRLVGDFYGWTGNTVFRLENGQVWKQAGPGYFRIHLKNPKVVIKKLLIGYVLLVEGYAKEVFVRRIR